MQFQAAGDKDVSKERRPSVLVVEDTPSLSATYRAILEKQNFAVETAATGAEALERLAHGAFDALVLDVRLPDMTGLDVLDALRERGDETEAVVITADGSINLAVDAMRRGAFDFIVKPLNAHRLAVTVSNATERARLKAEVSTLRRELGDESGFCQFIGRSAAMQTVYRIIRNAGPSNATVFVLGESGTGKELCADAVHRSSKRASGPFVTLNCAAIPKDLLESEIFGHVRGAFSGATADRKGAALSADGGTLFLDEICEMDIALQSKLLRFLQNKEVQRLGEDKVQRCDVRIVCASNRDPLAEVQAGRFREDLYYRLHVIPIELPPLRERGEDIVELAEWFLARFSREEGKAFNALSADALAAMRHHSWPGNVRQLENLMRRLVVLNDGHTIELHMLPADIRASAATATPGVHGPAADARRPLASTPSLAAAVDAPPVVGPLEATIREAIERAITASGGSIPKAAQMLDVSPSTLYRRIEAWESAAQ
ncbi:sigma-54-dependent Fis family transcriptional regulator [Aquibium carbonis]|uniref:Sigma-54-dependent Fis family transcriptional regulator n=1 Tax=Aquibium carbonis TaxID=2495581 RepID=A0A3S0A764_9HYPH|nr:sigma-54 dependent transcriptional regulator [Aquibium carbonis]RST85401.1 sigma-54-dependent Fis family transcriptional regulator [Aquibium carbonis]